MTGGLVNAARSGATVDVTLAKLHAGVPGASIVVASIPDVYQLWSIQRNDPMARFIWSTFKVCPSMLASPLSNAAADVTRRATVRARIVGFNAALAASCSATPGCRFDGNAVFNHAFTPAEVSSLDHFHPGIAGQAVLSALTWGG